MTTKIYVLKSVLTDEDETAELPVFASMARAQKFLESTEDLGFPKRWTFDETTSVWTGHEGDDNDAVTLTEVSVPDADSTKELLSLLMVRFNTYHERDVFLGAFTTLEAAKRYAQDVIDRGFPYEPNDDSSLLRRREDGTIEVRWEGDDTVEHENLISDVGGHDDLSCLIERTRML